MAGSLHVLDQAGVQWVRILWCDNANVIRAKAAHRRLLDRGLPDGVGITLAQQALPVMFDSVAPDSGLSPVGEARLVPDWETLAVLPWAPTHAHVLGDMRLDGAPWAHCPREYLRSQVRALAEAGFTARAAFENEFFLLRKTAGGYAPADSTAYAATGALNAHRPFIDELTGALESLGLETEWCYPESAPGQIELTVRHAEPLAAADRQVIYREAVRAIAPSHGYVASFLPKVIEGAAGSGCHLNISLWRDGANAMGDAAQATGLSPTSRAFLAGLMDHLPGLAAVTVPTCNSYRRLAPHFWAGAYRVWGRDNREAAVRVAGGVGNDARLELKMSDASANPYLALGAMIAAGLDGVRRGLEPPAEITVDPGLLAKDERRARGIEPLPATLGDALDHLAADSVLMASLGPERARAYIAVKRMESAALAGLTLEEEVRLLAERY